MTAVGAAGPAASAGPDPREPSPLVDAVVLGRGLPALLAALDLAEVGLHVIVTSGADELPDGPVRDPDGVLAAALERAARPIDGGGDASDPALLPETIVHGSPLLLDREGHWAPQSEPSVLGIPAVPLSTECLHLLGSGGAIRAYLDRVMPLLTIGKTRSFGELVRRRLGAAALGRLSEPMLRERFGVSAAEVEVAVAAPGLNEALSRTGSLTSAALAYADRNVARETAVMPAGGWERLRASLLRRLSAYAVEVIDASVEEVALREDESWAILLSDGRTIASRAVVLDPGAELDATPSAGRLWAPIAELRPRHERMHADIDIQPIPQLTAPATAVRMVGQWTVRVDIRSEGGARARVSGPRAEAKGVAGGIEAGPSAVSPSDPLSRITGEFEAALSGAGLLPEPGAEWRIHRRAAPYVSLAEREQAAFAIGELHGRHVGLLPIGPVLHGDDLPAAIAAAQHATVVLRRNLLGLADAE